jgi:hypothetical protein
MPRLQQGLNLFASTLAATLRDFGDGEARKHASTAGAGLRRIPRRVHRDVEARQEAVQGALGALPPAVQLGILGVAAAEEAEELQPLGQEAPAELQARPELLRVSWWREAGDAAGRGGCGSHAPPPDQLEDASQALYWRCSLSSMARYVDAGSGTSEADARCAGEMVAWLCEHGRMADLAKVCVCVCVLGGVGGGGGGGGVVL